MRSKIPLNHSKYGITIMDKENAQKCFVESFYSNTELAREIIAATDKFAASNTPLMITGEIGTSKDRVAYIYYAKSSRCNYPLYVINCSMLNDKTWNFIIIIIPLLPIMEIPSIFPISVPCPTNAKSSCYPLFWIPTCTPATA